MERKQPDTDRTLALVGEELVSSLRHELKNHLAAIQNANYYLRDRVTTGAPGLVAADRRIPELFALVEQVLGSMNATLSTASGERRGLAPYVDVTALVRDVVKSFEPPPHVRLEVDALQAIEASVDADDFRLALRALLANAVEALGAKGGRAWVRVTSESGRVVVEVGDDGPGFAQDAQKSMEPFFSTKGHAGVGLTLAKRVVGRVGGSLNVANGDAGGARVTLTLRGRDEVAANVVTAPASGGRSVLLVDDSEIVRATLSWMLEGAGYGIVEAASLAEAREQLQTGSHFDLALVDYNLEDGLGTELVDDIRRASPHTRIALCSADGDVGVHARGFDAVVEKTADPEQFLEQIAAFTRFEEGTR